MFTRFLRRFSSRLGKDYYKVLGVDVKSSKADIRSAYLNLAKLHHPDSPSGNEEKFKELGEAWSVLSDEKSKMEYDYSRSSSGNRPWDSYGFQKTDGYSSGRSQKSGFDSEEWQQQFKTGSRNPYGKNPFDTQWDEFFRKSEQARNAQDSQSTKGKTRKAQYYEYFDPKTGKRVFYSFTSHNTRNSEAGKNNTGNIYEEFMKDKFQNKHQDWEDRENRTGILDALSSVAVFFSLLLFLSLFFGFIRRASQRKRHNAHDAMYMNQHPREHVWDDFARDMHKRTPRER